MSAPATVIPAHTLQDIEDVNATGLTPVVFIHGLWLLPSSWDRWAPHPASSAGCHPSFRCRTTDM